MLGFCTFTHRLDSVMDRIQASIEELSAAEIEFGDHVSKRKEQVDELKDLLDQVTQWISY